MHGIIFQGLTEFVIETYDESAWDRIRDDAGVGRKRYVPVAAYPDEELVALVEAAVAISDLERAALLRAFGRALVPTLIDMYGVYVDDDWTALDLVANVEDAIHTALRGGDSLEYDPPAIAAARIDADVALVTYASERGLCDVAMGIVEGIGDHYDEPLEVYERRCRYEGAPRCELVAVSGATTRSRADSLIDEALSDG